MTYHHFSALSQAKQQEVVLTYGAYIADRIRGSFLVVLYQIEGFYVEILYLRNNYDIFLLKSFTSTEMLDPYLQEIDLTQLVKEC